MRRNLSELFVRCRLMLSILLKHNQIQLVAWPAVCVCASVWVRKVVLTMFTYACISSEATIRFSGG